jgi:hypothetical protein
LFFISSFFSDNSFSNFEIFSKFSEFLFLIIFNSDSNSFFISSNFFLLSSFCFFSEIIFSIVLFNSMIFLFKLLIDISFSLIVFSKSDIFWLFKDIFFSLSITILSNFFFSSLFISSLLFIFEMSSLYLELISSIFLSF